MIEIQKNLGLVFLSTHQLRLNNEEIKNFNRPIVNMKLEIIIKNFFQQGKAPIQIVLLVNSTAQLNKN